MSGVFEHRTGDAAGRIGDLRVPRSDTTVETPALLPVVNPHVGTIAPARLEAEFGASMLITNGYILYTSDEYRDAARTAGLHDLLDFSGPIMTDSGAFQLAEYGDIDATTAEILAFQHEIGADIGTPIDLPTPPDVGQERAESDLETTQERLAVAEEADTGEMLVNAPVQGSTYPDLRETAARHAADTNLDVFPIGAVVPLLKQYRYAEVVETVVAAKRGLGPAAPVHLFGAGHPMTFALWVALGCDLFDSAAYALFARDDRYLTVRGTEHLEDLDYFPCSCPVCTARDPADLRDRGDDDRERLLAEHNLHTSFAEIRRIKQAIRAGNLLELVEARARGHPAMVDGYRALLDHADWLERADPVSKGAFFHLSAESARRPEVARHHDRLERLALDPGAEVLLTEASDRETYDECWRVVPPFGPFPRALSDTYPLTAEVPERTDRRAYERAATGVARLANANPDTHFTLAHHDWPATALNRVPERVSTIDLDATSREHEGGDGDDGDDDRTADGEHTPGKEQGGDRAEPTDSSSTDGEGGV